MTTRVRPRPPPGPMALVVIDETGHALSGAAWCGPNRFEEAVDVSSAPYPVPLTYAGVANRRTLRPDTGR